MRQSIVVRDFQSHAPGVGRSQSPEQSFVFLVARSQHNQHQILFHQRVRFFRHQIEPLLVREARNNPDDRPLQVFLRQRKRFQQISFACLLAAQILRRIIRRNQRIFRRIPRSVIHAVQNPQQVVRSFSCNTIQPVSEFSRLNLLRVLPAHRRQII